MRASGKDRPHDQEEDMPDTTAPPRYAGPLTLDAGLHEARAHRRASKRRSRATGPRADAEYRDLGWAAANWCAIGAKHIRAIGPFEQPTGWHWHDMNAHFVIVLRGWITFRYAGRSGSGHGACGATLSQPAGVAHNVVARSDDMELIEINMPAVFGAWDLPGFDRGPQTDSARWMTRRQWSRGSRDRIAPRCNRRLAQARGGALLVFALLFSSGNSRCASSASRSICCRRPRACGASSPSASTR
jgi:hypothetical protein